MVMLVTNGAIPTLPLYNFFNVQGQFYLGGIEPDNLHRFTDSSLKFDMKNQLTRVTRGQLTCTMEAIHVPVFNMPTAGNYWGGGGVFVWEGLLSNPSEHKPKPD